MRGILTSLVVLLLWGCERQPTETSELLIDPVVLGTRVAEWQEAKLRSSVASTTAMINETRRFLETPGADTRQDWQDAWNHAHEEFHHATLLLDPESLRSIDVWPIAPGFIDSLPGYPESGIINDLALDIIPDTLHEQHMITDTSEAALGFHVVEYYAFARPIEDMLPGDDRRHERRRLLIMRVSDLLLMQMQELQNSLQTNSGESLPQSTYEDLVARLARRTDSISSALNFSSEHGEFSRRQHQIIRSQFTAIHELLNDEVDLNRYLKTRNEAQAKILNNTLSEAINLIPETGPMEESSSSRLQLLAAAISHQLEDFSTTN